jgi:hypothetical protein
MIQENEMEYVDAMPLILSNERLAFPHHVFFS